MSRKRKSRFETVANAPVASEELAALLPGVNIPNATKAHTELFVGNLAPDIDVSVFVLFCNAALKNVGLVPHEKENAVEGLRMKDRFAFLICSDPETATAALNLNGIPFLGTNIKVSRPSHYDGPETPSKTWQEITGQPPLPDGLLSSGNPDSSDPTSSSSSAGTDIHTKPFREIFVGNFMTPDMTTDGLSKFLGDTLKMLCFTQNQKGNPVINVRHNVGHRFCFVELQTLEEATNMLNLNGIVFKGQSLKISRPTKFDTVSGAGPIWYRWEDLLRDWANGKAKLLTAGTNSTCLQIVDIISWETLMGKYKDDDKNILDMNDVLEDCREECNRFGQVVKLYSPRPENCAQIAKDLMINETKIGSGSVDSSEFRKLGQGVGSIFIQMASVDEAREALIGLKGRLFDDHIVDVRFVDEKNMPPEIPNGPDDSDPAQVVVSCMGTIDMTDILNGLRHHMKENQITAFKALGYM